MRAAFTDVPHLSLWLIVPVLLGFAAVFLTLGLRNFRRRVLSSCLHRSLSAAVQSRRPLWT
jgi:hypothetical protein